MAADGAKRSGEGEAAGSPPAKRRRGGGPAYMLGIDEAGRGPVLGPMVYGTCFCPVDRLDGLKAMGFADSKVLSAEDRERLFADIKACEWLDWLVDVISPVDMSAKMLRREKYNLNAISHDSAMGLIRAALDSGRRLTEVYVDTVGDPRKYQAKLAAAFPGIDKIVVEKKADSKFPIVSAASICAKVTRDQDLEGWVFPEEKAKGGPRFGRAMGSGYPGDRVTKQWLVDHIDPVFGFPSLVRFGWGTCKKILLERCVPFEWDDDDDENAGRGGRGGGGGKQSKISASFSSSRSEQGSRSEVPLARRPRFFQRRGLQIVSSLSAPVEE